MSISKLSDRTRNCIARKKRSFTGKSLQNMAIVGTFTATCNRVNENYNCFVITIASFLCQASYNRSRTKSSWAKKIATIKFHLLNM